MACEFSMRTKIATASPGTTGLKIASGIGMDGESAEKTIAFE